MFCPRCFGENIVNEDCFDISSTPFSLTEHMISHCKECGATIMYNRVYQFVGIEDIEVVSDN